jgi:hypothetical protein
MLRHAIIISMLTAVCIQSLLGGESTNLQLRSGPARIKELEQKAGDRDFLANRCRDLERELTEVRAALSNADVNIEAPTTGESVRRLQDVERKAMAYDGMIAKIEKRDTMIADLNKQLKDAGSANKQMQEQVDLLMKQLGGLSNQVARLEQADKSLRGTVEQLLMGNYEYYEVREGDTVESVAAMPTIYGDASRKEWIRQANRSRVEDLDHLRHGEMLIIPRFPPSGRYEF